MSASSFDALAPSMEGLSVQMDSSKQLPQERLDLRKTKIVTNVHQDDIHGLVKLPNGTFISGSKDGSLKIWKVDGKLSKVVYDPQKIDYKQWITAVAVVNDIYWMSGTRDGYVQLWNIEGKRIRDINIEPYIENYTYKCKDRNSNRINCLTSFENISGKNFIFAGWPTQFTLHNYKTDKRWNYTYTSQNDWVYAVEPIHKTALLVITGCRLDLWEQNLNNFGWHKSSTLIEEDRKVQPRPYISSISPLKNNKGMYGLAVFDGSIRVVELETKKTVFEGYEHKNRVWTVENTQPSCFASCADDGLIKLWDIRQAPKSIVTVTDNEKDKSRVSVLLQIADNQLLSGSCPDNVRKTKDKAQFSFWDLRKIK